ncbi:hypothetical protein I4641_14825 [Waterburya agarophytonicola K14]|uniref:Uncharacterized protein n=1 Tax=Waterburya agarophytonicola KI4 TaxID=2874699 RepID=A0A964BT62_9CYAN|nr:hypothetical protein [Waterburya agarophytonicola]MCC0178252.1 hypothetical protein [Waterburya agarophytonicola KI4]
MIQENQSKFNWRNTFGALAVGLVSLGCLDTFATAAPIPENFEIAQVGIRSRVQSPVPLNLKPRFHTPLPRSNYSNYRHHDYGRDNYHHPHHSRNSRNRDRGKVIIISPGGIYGSHRNESDRGSYYNRGSYNRHPHGSDRRTRGSYIQIGL